jgi:adenylate cyclase
MAGEISGEFLEALRLEILRSERLRMRVLAIILAILLVATTAAAYFTTDFGHRLFRGGIEPWVPAAAIGPFLVFELVALGILHWRMSHKLDFPTLARFANVLIETSLPGVVIYVLARRSVEPQLVFGFWPPLLYFLFILLSTLRLDFWLSLWTGTVAAIEQIALAMWLLPLSSSAELPVFDLEYHLGRSIVLAIGGIVAGLVAVRLRRQFARMMAAAAARDRVTNLFGQHVSPAVVDKLLAASADPPSETRTVCVLFLDIRGFTAMTRLRPAAETVALLNDFFAEMVAIVDRHHGIINKFLGDGFLALFGAPIADPAAARQAITAAKEMLDAVDRWNEVRPKQSLRVGIGIHSGEAVTGTVGSPQRKEYTVIGDTVNLAARLEQLTKETGARLLVSEALGALAAESGGVELEPMAIRGYDKKVPIWRVA